MLQTPTPVREEDMIEEEIVVGGDDSISKFSQDELIPAVVRSEINFLRFPFFSLHCRGLRKDNKKVVYEFSEIRNGKREKFKLSIIPSTDYGRPTYFDRRVARAIDVILDETYMRNGNTLENPIPFSVYRVAELMGRKSSRSGRLYRDIKESIERISATMVKSEGFFYLRDEKVWVDRIFSFYTDVVFIGMQQTGGGIAETNFISLHDLYLRNVNARFVQPLDYSFLVGLEHDLAARLYEVLSPKFYGLRKGTAYYHVDYLNLCNMLPITPQRYFSAAQRNLKPAHDVLAREGYLEKVVYVLHEGKKSIKTVRYYPGKYAKQEMRGKFGGRQAVLIEGQLASPLPDKENTRLSPLAQELTKRGIKPQRIAIELCESYPKDYIQGKIKIFDFFMNADDGTISDNPAGWLRTAIEADIKPTEKQVRVGKTAVRQQAEERIKELELAKSRIKKPYEEECNKIFNTLIAEHGDTADKALQEARKEIAILEQFYKPKKPFTEQMMMLQVSVRPRLREQFPDSFKTIDEEHEAKISEIDARIEALKTEAKNKLASA